MIMLTITTNKETESAREGVHNKEKREMPQVCDDCVTRVLQSDKR